MTPLIIADFGAGYVLGNMAGQGSCEPCKCEIREGKAVNVAARAPMPMWAGITAILFTVLIVGWMCWSFRNE